MLIVITVLAVLAICGIAAVTGRGERRRASAGQPSAAARTPADPRGDQFAAALAAYPIPGARWAENVWGGTVAQLVAALDAAVYGRAPC